MTKEQKKELENKLYELGKLAPKIDNRMKLDQTKEKRGQVQELQDRLQFRLTD